MIANIVHTGNTHSSLTFAVRIMRQNLRTAGILIILASRPYASVTLSVSSLLALPAAFSFFIRATKVVVTKNTVPQKNKKSGDKRYICLQQAAFFQMFYNFLTNKPHNSERGKGLVFVDICEAFLKTLERRACILSWIICNSI